MKTGEMDIDVILRSMSPRLNEGEYVFVTLTDISQVNRNDTICELREAEGTTVVIEKSKADELGFTYNYVAAWITLNVHSALESVGLTAAFSTALTQHNISCNVIAGFYHDHIFVDAKDATKAIEVITNLSKIN
ncbi:MAG: hypothetical protein ACI9V1_000501 [Spirosomataceae bacterium]